MRFTAKPNGRLGCLLLENSAGCRNMKVKYRCAVGFAVGGGMLGYCTIPAHVQIGGKFVDGHQVMRWSWSYLLKVCSRGVESMLCREKCSCFGGCKWLLLLWYHKTSEILSYAGGQFLKASWDRNLYIVVQVLLYRHLRAEITVSHNSAPIPLRSNDILLLGVLIMSTWTFQSDYYWSVLRAVRLVSMYD